MTKLSSGCTLASFLAACSLTLVACADEPGEDYGVMYGPGIRENQGRETLGGLADGYAGVTSGRLFTMSTTTSQGAVHLGATPSLGTCLRDSSNACRDFAGATATASDGSTLTIHGAVVVDPTHYLYDVSRNGAPLCDPAQADPSALYPGLAVATSGGWTKTGLHEYFADRLSWACASDGVVAKTIDWGFLPGGSPAQAGVAWTDHQLATRMAHADYCYTGSVHTIDETVIQYYQPDQGPPLPPWSHALPADVAPNTLYAEAAWVPSPNNEDGQVACLSRLRWSTMPVGDQCGGALPDPRLHAELNGYCEDWTIEYVWTGTGARLFNESEFNALSLWQWHKNGDHYASGAGFFGGVRTTETVRPPGAGPAYTTIASDRLGTMLTVDGKATWLARYPGASFVKLQTAKHATNGDWITTIASAMPNGYGAARDEGFLFASVPNAANRPSTAVFTALYRYKATAGGDFLTTTTSPAPNGYANPVLLGYLVEL